MKVYSVQFLVHLSLLIAFDNFRYTREPDDTEVFSTRYPLLDSLIISEIVSLVYEFLSPPCSSCIEDRPNVNSPVSTSFQFEFASPFELRFHSFFSTYTHSIISTVALVCTLDHTMYCMERLWRVLRVTCDVITVLLTDLIISPVW